jgi:hypothetical protein
MMEEDEPLEHAPTVTATAPTIVHDKVNIVSVAVGISSEPPSKVSQDQSITAPAPAPAAMDMEMEEDTQPYQPCRNASFFSGLWQSPQIPTLLMGKVRRW